MEQYRINKDFLKSTIFHVIIIIIITVGGLLQNKLIFSSSKQQINFVKNSSIDTAKSITKPYLDQPVKASLIDHNMIEQAIKRQELQANEKINRAKKLEQKEQQVANLKKVAEQEALKAKQEMQKVEAYKKQLQKEYNDLQESGKKLKQQAKALVLEQEKLKQQSQALAVEKKKQKNLINNQEISNTQLTEQSNKVNILDEQGLIASEIGTYYTKWKNEIINNRKKIMFLGKDMTCAVRIKLLPNGHLSLVKIEKSSGNVAYDKFSEQAIYKSAPFEMPQDPVLNKELASTEHVIHFDDNSFSD